jgi:hypothetical protein
MLLGQDSCHPEHSRDQECSSGFPDQQLLSESGYPGPDAADGQLDYCYLKLLCGHFQFMQWYICVAGFPSFHPNFMVLARY